MKSEHSLEPRRDLQSVCDAFEQWRRTRQTTDRIPESLWEAAADLCISYPVFRIAKALRLDYNKLKHRIQQRSSRSVPSGFVELKVHPLFSSVPCVVEIRSPSGFEMKIKTEVSLNCQLPELISSFVSQIR